MPGVDIREALAKQIAAIQANAPAPPLWPAPYDEDTVESATRFCLNLHTWNESEKEAQPMPDSDYLKAITREWFDAKDTGGAVHILKARRMVVSWWCRGLELHQMGLGRQDWVLGGEKYVAAARHVWRYKWLYESLQRRHPTWNLQDCKTLAFQGDRALTQFSLPNGSTCVAINGESSNIQGEGYTGVVFEEASLYPHLQAMVGQAKIVTQASPGKIGGFLVTIANPEHHFGYWEMVSGVS